MRDRVHGLGGIARLRLSLGILGVGMLFLPAALAQQSPVIAETQLPDAPVAHSGLETAETGIQTEEDSPDELAEASLDTLQSTPPQQSPAAPPASTGTVPLAPTQAGPASPAGAKTTTQEELQKAEHQRIMGVMPAFNSVTGGVAAPLTPREKFQLMFKSTTDPYVFGFAAFTAGIGQARDSFAEYGQGAQGYFKRFGASYADTADGNLWGNAILPVVMHEDPRYFRKGHGTFKRRLLYSMATTVICKRDNGTTGPNYANLLGNLIAGGISNVYYPAADRDVGLTFQNAATVTAEGMIGAFLLEFSPDFSAWRQRNKQRKLDAAATANHTYSPAKPVQ